MPGFASHDQANAPKLDNPAAVQKCVFLATEAMIFRFRRYLLRTRCADAQEMNAMVARRELYLLNRSLRRNYALDMRLARRDRLRRERGSSTLRLASDWRMCRLDW